MEFTELLITLKNTLHEAGGWAGAVGGSLGAEVWRRFRTAEHSAKAALAAVAVLRTDFEKIREEFTKHRDDVKQDVSRTKGYISGELSKMARGSRPDLLGGFAADAKLLERLAVLESRASSLEDDFDTMQKKDIESWQEVMTKMTRVETILEERQDRQDRRDRRD